MEWIKLIVEYGIIGILVLMSICSIAIAIERYLTYRNIRIEKFKNKNELEIEITKRLHLIATIGSNAPYIGLLGTVLGIMFIFYIMGENGLGEPGKIMVGLALALKATAIGLLVAIPSIILYSLLLRKVKVILMEWEMENGREGI